MTTSLRDLGARAGAVPVPQLDVAALVAAGEARLRRRRATAVAAVAAVVAVVVSASVLLAPGSKQAAPPPSGGGTTKATGDTVETSLAPRLLTYAVGSVIHWGDRTVDVREQIPGRSRPWLGFLEPTDDGVVFISGPRLRNGGVAYDEPVPVWFTDGSTPVRIGTTSGSGVRGYLVAPSASGSTVAWREDYYRGVLVVYDTARMREVARFGDENSYILNEVYDDEVYWTSDGSCGTDDTRTGSLTRCEPGAKLMRFDVGSQLQTEVTWDEYVADRRSRPGLLTGPDHRPPGCISCVISPDGLYRSHSFVRRGSRLVLGADYGLRIHALPASDRSITVALTGTPVNLRLPRGYEDAERWVLTQWLDADHIVLWADGEPAGVTDRGKTVELLICQLSTGDCRVAAGPDQADGLFTPPGPAGIKG